MSECIGCKKEIGPDDGALSGVLKGTTLIVGEGGKLVLDKAAFTVNACAACLREFGSPTTFN